MSEYKRIPPEVVPAGIRPHTDLQSPPTARLLAAQGIAPLRPLERVFSLYLLLADPDQKIAQAAAKTLTSLPDAIFTTALKDPALHPFILHFLFFKLPRTDQRRTVIIQNPSVSDDTLVVAARTGTKEQLEIIATNQRRSLAHIPILKALYENPETPKDALLRLIEYAQRDGIVVEEIPELAKKTEAPAAELPEWTYEQTLERAQEALPKLPEDILKLLPLEELMQIALQDTSDDINDILNMSEEEEFSEEEFESFYRKVQKMSVAQKIVLAQKGNKNVRTLLLRDSNKLVLMAVINSPQITDGEILMTAQNRAMPEEIIRAISMNKEWTKEYSMKVALAYNPKCPVQEAMRYIQSLQKRDLRDLSKSKNVPSNISTYAKKLYQLRYKDG
ncbi:MAG: hypothetical protein Kow0090_15500 [Myxococcota bacterium]